jgi:hypothetical protein
LIIDFIKAPKDENTKSKKEKFENEAKDNEKEENTDETITNKNDEMIKEIESKLTEEKQTNAEVETKESRVEPEGFNTKIMSWNVNGIRKWVEVN